jgi:hypothetical protein
MQPMPMATKVANSIPASGDVYSIHSVIDWCLTQTLAVYQVDTTLRDHKVCQWLIVGRGFPHPRN